VFWITEEDRIDHSDPSPVLYPGSPLSRHLLKSLRAEPGDVFRFVVADPPVSFFKGTVVTSSPLTLSLEDEIPASDRESHRKFDLAVALLKGDSWEDLVEPLVCLGTRTLVPLLTDRVQVRWSREQYEKKMIRFKVKIREASQLAGRTDRMNVPPPVSLEGLLGGSSGFILFLDEQAGAPPVQEILSFSRQDVMALTGPEGGWSSRERTLLQEFEKSGRGARANLGSLVLPGRLAPVVIASILSFCFPGSQNESAEP
jgi:16S rRNA (uracil1498-N3)-methyltransferase